MAATPLDVQDAALARIRALLLRDLDRIWDGLLDQTDPAGSLARVGPLAAARIVAAQSAALGVAVGYADAVLAAAFGSAMLPVAVPGAALIGVDRRGRDIAAMLAGSQGAFERRVSSGLPPPDAVRAERSFQSALAGSAVHDTDRAALTGMADPRSGWRHPQVQGWSRVAHPGACAFCVMLAGRGYAYTSEKSARTARDGSRYHDRCRCSVAIGPAGTRDPAAEAAYRQWTAGSGGNVGTGGRRQPAVPPGPRLSDTDQARLNAANSEANRLNAQAYKLERQGRGADAAALREQAAAHRAEADRITDNLRGTAGGGGGQLPPLRGQGTAAGPPRPPTYVQLVNEPGRVGVGLEHLGAGDPPGSRRRQIESARRLEAMYSVTIRSVRKTNDTSPDLVVDTWSETCEIKNPNVVTESSFHAAIRKGRRQSTHIFVDVTDLGSAADERLSAGFIDAALRTYPEPTWVTVIGPGWTIERRR